VAAREPAAVFAPGLVMDASVTMAWFFPDEATGFTEALLESLGTRQVWVPALWVAECANVLQSAARRGRLLPGRRVEIAQELAELPVTVDAELPSVVPLDRLAATHSLSAYNATYLELAQRRNLPLATLDRSLRLAAQAAGVALADSGEAA
jgi:predicted nucleic acid-binding protein